MSSTKRFGALPNVEIHIDASKTFTTALVKGARHTGIGTAKRNPADPYDYQTGLDVALSRALRDLADRLDEGLPFT